MHLRPVTLADTIAAAKEVRVSQLEVGILNEDTPTAAIAQQTRNDGVLGLFCAHCLG